jgi:hypothetical protein
MFRLSTTPKVAWPRWREVAAQKIWPAPEAVVTVLCTPDDGCGWHPKHVEWTCRITDRLLCVASSWTIISIDITYLTICDFISQKRSAKSPPGEHNISLTTSKQLKRNSRTN